MIPSIEGSVPGNSLPSGAFSSQGTPLNTHQAYRSRATPQWEAASTRFAVISYSMTASVLRCRYSLAGVPTTASSGSTIMPSWELPMPSSSSAHIIPSDSTPRILDFLILKSPGRTVPMRAKRTFCPAATLGAPQTTVSGSGLPSSTLVIWRWSLSGWGSHSSTFATTTPARPPGISSLSSTPSTSMPIEVIASATWAGVRSHFK